MQNRLQTTGHRPQVEKNFFPNPRPLTPDPYSSPYAAQRRAFTLTELLVVISIIAVLAGLITVAVLRALDTAKQTAIKAEVDQLDAAMKMFKDKYGAYPPALKLANMQNRQAVKAFVARAFPRYTGDIFVDLPLVVDTIQERPDQALVFWLGGFNPDPTQPFLNLNNLKKAERKDVLFDFDPARLKIINSGVGALSYVQKGSKKDVPYLYFEMTSQYPQGIYASSHTWDPTVMGGSYASAGWAHLYADKSGIAKITVPPGIMTWPWMNPESYQIIAAGNDEVYGEAFDRTGDPTYEGHLYPDGAGYDPAGSDDDNVTNFCGKARLSDAKP